MKKFAIMIISIITLSLVLCSCSNSQKPNDETGGVAGVGVVNPVSDCTLDDISNELGLQKIELKDVTINTASKIDDGNGYVIYSIDITEAGTEYNVRIAKYRLSYNADISGVYFSGDVNYTILDSADVDVSPSVNVEASDEGAKAYCSWKGYYFSVSTESKISSQEFCEKTVQLAKAIISRADSDFEITFHKGNDSEIKVLYETDDYNVKAYGGDVDITIEKDMVYSLEDALCENIITSNDIVDKCKSDEEKGIIKSEMYKDGGSTEYYYDDFTVLKLNTLDGDKDLIIGRKGTLIGDYDKFVAE